MVHALFICDWDYSYLWEKVAARLIEAKSIRRASALVIGKVYYTHLKKKQVFENLYLLQSSIEQIPSLKDGALNFELERKVTSLEKRYSDTSLWKYMWADRSLPQSKISYARICQYLLLTFEYFEELLKSENPDVIFTNNFGSMPHTVLYAVAKKMGIRVIRPLHLRIKDYYRLDDTLNEDLSWALRKINDANYTINPELIKKAKNMLEEFRNLPAKPNYEKSARNRIDYLLPLRFIRYFYRYYISRTYANDHTKSNPFIKAMKLLHLRLRAIAAKSWLKWDELPKNLNFAYFPLHLQPEASTMNLAPFYLNQVALIENIAKSLPANICLVVKEHPKMLGRREKQYYESIKKIPNVILVHPFTDNFSLIKESKLILTITGTAGLEGLIFKKPVVMFGQNLFSYCPLITYLGDVGPTKWHKSFLSLIQSYKHNDELFIKYLAILFDGSFHGLYIEPLINPQFILSDDNILTLSKKIEEELLVMSKELSSLKKESLEPSYGY